MTATDESPGKWTVVDVRSRGYATETVTGRCGPDVTREDIEKEFYHPHFGGRGAWCKDGRFGATIHTD